MLVLSRKRSQSIIIDGRITVTILEARRNVVRLGIDALREIPVHRSELVHSPPAKQPTAA